MATELDNRISGPVFVAGDSGYAPEIAAFNTAIVHSPDLVVGAESAADVVETVRFAREHGYPVSVQATGHTEEPITSGLLISTRRLDGVSIDPGRRTATIGAGTLWEAVVAAAAEHGLAPVGDRRRRSVWSAISSAAGSARWPAATASAPTTSSSSRS